MAQADTRKKKKILDCDTPADMDIEVENVDPRESVENVSPLNGEQGNIITEQLKNQLAQERKLEQELEEISKEYHLKNSNAADPLERAGLSKSLKREMVSIFSKAGWPTRQQLEMALSNVNAVVVRLFPALPKESNQGEGRLVARVLLDFPLPLETAQALRAGKLVLEQDGGQQEWQIRRSHSVRFVNARVWNLETM